MLVQITRFGVVGIVGTVLNICIFALLVTGLKLNHNVGSVVAFLVAVTHNYVMNRAWTFASRTEQNRSLARGWAKYFSVNLLGFGVNLIVLNAVVAVCGPRYDVPGQMLGILVGMALNFLLSRHFVFGRTDAAHDNSERS